MKSCVAAARIIRAGQRCQSGRVVEPGAGAIDDKEIVTIFIDCCQQSGIKLTIFVNMREDDRY